MAVFQHWSYDPFILVIAVVVAVHGRGLRKHLKAIAKSGRPTRPWIGQAFIFWAGLVVLLLAVVSPVDYWSDSYLSAHVVQHILLAFVAPPLIVIGAPWVPLLRGLPRPVARVYGRLLRYTRARATGCASAGLAAQQQRCAGSRHSPYIPGGGVQRRHAVLAPARSVRPRRAELPDRSHLARAWLVLRARRVPVAADLRLLPVPPRTRARRSGRRA